MAFKEYAKEYDFCRECSPFHWGDRVTVLHDIKTRYGIIEKGTVLKVETANLNIPVLAVTQDEVSQYEVTPKAFYWTLQIPNLERSERNEIKFFYNDIALGELSALQVENTNKEREELYHKENTAEKISTALHIAFIVLTIVATICVYLWGDGTVEGIVKTTGTFIAGFVLSCMGGMPLWIAETYHFTKKL